MIDHKKMAINFALHQDWQQAVDYNLNYLEENPKDIDTYNRLGFAYLQLGQIDKSTQSYQKALEFDPYNSIAKKSLDKLNHFQVNQKVSLPKHPSPVKISFLEEPGKTKTVTLTRPAESKILAGLNVGTPVELIPKKHRINAQTSAGQYIGSLPDDLSYRLGNFIKLGYKYECWVKSVSVNSACVFIKETQRSKKGMDAPSFPVVTSAVKSTFSLTAPDFIQVPVDTSPLEEEDY